MKKQEKIEYLQDNHGGEWKRTFSKQLDALSESQGVFCCCGRLATGLHESSCSKFHEKVRSATIKELQHLLPSKKSMEASQ